MGVEGGGLAGRALTRLFGMDAQLACTVDLLARVQGFRNDNSCWLDRLERVHRAV